MAFDFSASVISQLQNKQLLTAEQVAQLNQQKVDQQTDVLKLIEEQHIVTSEDLAKTKAEILNIEYIDLAGEQIPPEVLKIVPQEIADNYHIVPFKTEDDIVSVAFENPEDYRAIEALDFIGRQKKIRFKYYAATSFNIKHVLKQYGNLSDEVEEALATADVSDLTIDKEAEVQDEEVVKTAPVSKMISVMNSKACY